MFVRSMPRMAGFVFRENRVPYYQRLFQKNDGKALWLKTPGSGKLIYPFYASLLVTSVASTYAMCRLVFGKKTWI